MLRVENINYREKGFVLEDVSFSLGDGYIMTLLGENGAGKTTLLEVVYGNLLPSAGKIMWEETEVSDLKSSGEVAYVGDKLWCVPAFSPEKNIEMLQILYPKWDGARYQEILEKFGTRETLQKQPYGELSIGEKMQFQLAFHLARHPRLLLLDEPLANLDPVVKTDALDMVSRQCREEKMSIILSTHLVEEINDVTDYIGIVHQGKWMAYGDRETVFTENNAEDLYTLMRRMQDGKRGTVCSAQTA